MIDMLIPWENVLCFVERWRTLDKDKLITTLEEQATIRRAQANSIDLAIKNIKENR